MKVGTVTFPLQRYRILCGMALLFFSISMVQIISGGTGKIFAARIGEPFKWTISYTDATGKLVTHRFTNPAADSFNEGRTQSPMRVEMDLRECQTFNSYRFWVGPYGRDSTDRQPSEWTVLVRGEDGDWILADREQIDKPYQNNTWYIFPLHADKSCIRYVRWDISKIIGGDIFRLFRFQLYNPALFSAIR
jgi:hypothetical protein